MSCYFRHLKDIFAEAGITVNASNRHEIDQAIHKVVGTVHHKDCPNTWKKVKKEITTDEQKRREFIIKLKNAVK